MLSIRVCPNTKIFFERYSFFTCRRKDESKYAYQNTMSLERGLHATRGQQS